MIGTPGIAPSFGAASSELPLGDGRQALAARSAVALSLLGADAVDRVLAPRISARPVAVRSRSRRRAFTFGDTARIAFGGDLRAIDDEGGHRSAFAVDLYTA